MRHTNTVRLSPSFMGSLFIAASLGLFMGGCAGAPIQKTVIHHDNKSDVFIETVPNQSFQAAHPIKLDEPTVAEVLRGIHTREKTELVLLLGKALKAASMPGDVRTFYEDDIALLTPPITAALAQAAPNQRVGFRLSYPPVLGTKSTRSVPETTAGYLYADGLSLNFTLTSYRHSPKKNDTLDKAVRSLPDPNGLRDRDIKFIPEAAIRQEPEEQTSWFGKSDDASLSIDYQLLVKLLSAPLPAQTAPTASTPVAQPYQPAQPAPASRPDADMQAFKEELRALQKKVDEQNAELQRLKDPSNKKKSAQ
jgi:hypothetical protein